MCLMLALPDVNDDIVYVHGILFVRFIRSSPALPSGNVVHIFLGSRGLLS